MDNIDKNCSFPLAPQSVLCSAMRCAWETQLAISSVDIAPGLSSKEAGMTTNYEPDNFMKTHIGYARNCMQH